MKQLLTAKSQTALLERYKAAPTDDQMIQHLDIQQLPRPNDGAGNGDIIGLGVGSPLGWLCTKTSAVALRRTADRNSSPTRTWEVFTEPL
jgi:hypothetical protein